MAVTVWPLRKEVTEGLAPRHRSSPTLISWQGPPLGRPSQEPGAEGRPLRVSFPESPFQRRGLEVQPENTLTPKSKTPDFSLRAGVSQHTDC